MTPKTIDLPGHGAFSFHPMAEHFYVDRLAPEKCDGKEGNWAGLGKTLFEGKEITFSGTLVVTTTGVEKGL